MNLQEEGFTFLEAIIVLGIAALLLLITIPNFTKTRQKIDEQQFWQSLRQDWQWAQLKCESKHQFVVIRHDKNNEMITFRINDQTRETKEILIPSTLNVEWFGELYLTPNGYTRPCTQRFKSLIDGRYYYMKIQLGWGGYRIEKR